MFITLLAFASALIPNASTIIHHQIGYSLRKYDMREPLRRYRIMPSHRTHFYHIRIIVIYAEWHFRGDIFHTVRPARSCFHPGKCNSVFVICYRICVIFMQSRRTVNQNDMRHCIMFDMLAGLWSQSDKSKYGRFHRSFRV